MQPAVAQEEEILEEVTVTGSRASFSTADDAPVPVSILTNEMLTNTGATELGRAIQAAAPSFNFSSSTISDGTDALRPATLRGLGPDQTLVLINGKRRHTSALVHVNTSVGRGTAGTDMNAIPISAVKRVEVLRDGAAAQYGSDAIAGVINIILKDSATDGIASMEYGETFEGDGETWVANVNSGFALGSEGFVNLTYQYRDRGATNRAGLDGTRQYPCTDGTTIDFGCSTITTLDPREATYNRNSFRIGDADNEQHALAVNAAIDMGMGELYGFATYSTRDNQSGGFTRTASNATGNVLSIYPDGFLPLINTDIEDFSAFGGYRWDTASGWGFDISAGYGDNSFGFLISNSLNASLGAASPTSARAGELALDQTTVNFDASKLFDAGSIPFNVAWGAEYRDEGYQITPGEPASYENGEQVNPYTGQKYAPGFQVFRGFSPAEALNRSRDSWALYADLESQVTDKLLLTGALRYEDFSDFGDTTNWKVSGRFDATETFALRAAANTGFRAPSMQQQFFNSISTQFVSRPGSPGLFPEERGTFRNDSAVARALGIPQLKEEESDNYSLGVIWDPTENLSITVDYFKIDIDDRIVISGAISATNTAIPQEVRDVLLANNIGAAQFFTNAGKTETDGVEAVLSWAREMGHGQFRLDASAAFISTDVSGEVNTDGLLEGLEDVIFTSQDRSIIEEWQPENRASVTGSYALNNWLFLARLNYYGDYTIQEGNGDRQTFGSEWFPDVMVEYGFGDSGFSIQAGANNLTDTTPDRNLIGQSRAGSIPGIVDSPGVFTYSRRAAPFGFNGGYWYLKAIYRF
ncbi:MAG TPA: TonB-dependent receptor [Gammaproteobacteria bacterium]|jgi:iron complex outermembrane receptor protein